MLRTGLKGVRTFLERAYFATPSLALPFIQPEDKIYWLWSFYHVGSKQTLDGSREDFEQAEDVQDCVPDTDDLIEWKATPTM